MLFHLIQLDQVVVVVRVTLVQEQGDEMKRGQVLAQPGSISPHTTFESEVYTRAKPKAAVILGSSKATARSSTSGQLTHPGLSKYQIV
ncbi:hypothetical protein PTE_02114 [Photorhabdus khanii NC19]|uniref:Uncharacterized protein n=1 Tax=Photorhabdus khanii NC19 TaxID=1004151 RepID=W3V6J2_9GAMM|nr:hypothetical protein PTE_02114 [Photorhabdus khanii NC19]